MVDDDAAGSLPWTNCWQARPIRLEARDFSRWCVWLDRDDVWLILLRVPSPASPSPAPLLLSQLQDPTADACPARSRLSDA